MKISEIMSSDVVTVGTDTSLEEVAEVLAGRASPACPSSRTGVFAWLLDRYGFEGQLELEAHVAGKAK